MRMVDVIEKKRDGYELTDEEIRFFVKGYTDGSIPDYQASALAMAIVWRGMGKREIATLTDAMEHSGETIDLSGIKGIKVDKHSTGGVGDKTSLALGPLVAACGAKLAKMSGRGLGHTGGTLDKMESVPGTSVAIDEKRFVRQVNEIGLAIIGQTSEIDPADKKLYALRDVTGTVESIPLIASSIMSKKLASGADTILLDVKFGSGAFMKTIEEAKKLAETMVDIGDSLGRDTRAIITDMDEPLGLAVGNSLEVKEAIATLHGEGPRDFVELVTEAGAIMLEQAKIAKTHEEGVALIRKAIADGSGFEKQKELFAAQGGDVSYLEHPEKFKMAKRILPIRAERHGYVSRIDSLAIGVSAMKLGAGRATMNDLIDMSSGIILGKKVGDKVEKGDVVATAYTNKEGIDGVLKDIHDAFELSKSEVAVRPIVHAYIRK
ncbi:MAG: pyrimidine-nucleoside phosphorylase [Bacilli bacterium]|nr:pyrimidine-nucleoside phosphorylase [Bacilli bacterium]